jgi:hypothetical protein
VEVVGNVEMPSSDISRPRSAGRNALRQEAQFRRIWPEAGRSAERLVGIERPSQWRISM